MPVDETRTHGSKAFGLGVPILLALLLLIRLGAMIVVPLMDTTEARYGEIARKMAELNDWVTPWFDYGVPYWGKPPLSFWLTAASFDLFGVHEFAARLPHLAAAFAVIGLVAWMTSRKDPKSLWPAIVLLSASPVFFVIAGAVMTDIELVLGVTLSMAGFWLALETQDTSGAVYRPKWLPNLLFFSGLAIGLLAKGPVVVLLVAFPLFLWTALNSRWRGVWRGLRWISGLLLTALVALPWYLAAEQRTPGFLHYFLIGEHFQRFIEPGWAGDHHGNAHKSPIGAIWVYALAGLLPWSILMPIAIWRWRKPGTGLAAAFFSSGERQWRSYLLLWAITPLLLFTFARNVSFNYLLPGMPAAAIWGGQWLAAQARKGFEINRALCAGMLITLAVLCTAAVMWSRPAVYQQKSTGDLLAAYETSLSARGKTAAPLIFVRRRPFSAEFYTRGKALLAANADEAWSRIGPGEAYVAVIETEIFLGNAAAQKRVMQRIGRYGRFDLLLVEAR